MRLFPFPSLLALASLSFLYPLITAQRACSIACCRLLLSTFAHVLFFLHDGLAPLTFFLLSILSIPLCVRALDGKKDRRRSKGDLDGI
jgi:hypothetical protein